jgi:predicted enzyme related to lactoylglutathione lyase
MLGDKDAIATVAVKKLAPAKNFYEQTLGLTLDGPQQEPSVAQYRSGKSKLLVYESQYAGTNKATVVNWVVDDVEKVAKGLAGKGVKFEHYDFPGMTRKGDVHIAGDFKTAWFKDPDGNILSIISQ